MIGEYFHPSDTKKESYKELDKIKGGISKSLTKLLLIDILQRLGALIFWLDVEFVDPLFKNRDAGK